MAWIIGGFIAIGLVMLFYLRSGVAGCKYTFVPDGEDWRTFYRALRTEKKRGVTSGRVTWVAIGIGLGAAAIAAIAAMVTG